MNILLTGDDRGFIGPWLLQELQQAGYSARYWSHDVRTIRENALQGEDADVVVHLAARVGRVNSERERLDVIQTNAAGTMNVALACRHAGARLVYVSSSEAPCRRNLYGLTKLWGEEVAGLYMPSGELQIQRLYMPYGPGHPPGVGRAALTNFLWDAMHGRPLTVHRGTTRAWCWIGDTVRAMRRLLETDALYDHAPVDVGRTDNERSMVEVAILACVHTGAATKLMLAAPPGDITPAKRPDVGILYGLGWRPEVNLEQGMRQVHYWLEDNRARFELEEAARSRRVPIREEPAA